MLYGPDRCLSDCYICHPWEGKRGSKVREGGMLWQVKEGSAEESEREGVCAHLLCVTCRSAGAEADPFPH